MKLRVFVMILLFSQVKPLLADGNDLLRMCSEAEKFVLYDISPKDIFKFGQCVGIAQGVSNAMVLINNFVKKPYKNCLPETGLENGQVILITNKYLREHPEDLNQNETALTIFALMEAYPCHKKGN